MKPCGGCCGMESRLARPPSKRRLDATCSLEHHPILMSSEQARFEVLLEEMRSNFRAVAEGHGSLNDKIDSLSKDYSRLDGKVDLLAMQVSVLTKDVSVLTKDVSVLTIQVSVLTKDVAALNTHAGVAEARLSRIEQHLGPNGVAKTKKPSRQATKKRK